MMNQRELGDMLYYDDDACEHGRSVCSSVIELSRGDHEEYLNKVCHAHLNEYPCYDDTVRFTTSLWYDDDVLIEQQVLPYWRAILDSDVSPWRDVTKGFEYVYNSNGKLRGVSLFTVSDVPSDLFVSFCIASRLALEFPRKIKLFNKLMTHGTFTTNECLYMCLLGDYNMNGTVSIDQHESGHLPIGLSMKAGGYYDHPTSLSFNRFVHGDWTTYDSDPLTSSGTYENPNQCFAFGNDHEGKPPDSTEFIERPAYVGVFKQLHYKQYAEARPTNVLFDQWVKYFAKYMGEQHGIR